MKALIDTGKISTQAHVDQYVQTVSGPLTYLTSKCSEGVVKTAQTLQASTGSAAAFVSAEAKAAKDLSTQSSLPAVPQAAKLAEPKKVEAMQPSHLGAQHKSAAEIQVTAAVESEIVYAQTPEGIVFAIENNAGPKHSMSSAGPANPKTVVPVQKDVQWVPNKYKHFPDKNMPWKDIVKATENQKYPAKYKHDVNVELLDKLAWQDGITIKDGTQNKVFDCGKIIGAYKGKETQYMIVKYTSNTIHGHPISSAKYKEYLGKS